MSTPDYEYIASSKIDYRASWLTEVLLQRDDCATLLMRNQLREIGKSETIVRNYMNQQLADNHRFDDSVMHDIMCQNLEHMDEEAGFVRSIVHFLDLGCSPGGYATYIMQKFPAAVGVGISLPVASGGRNSMIPPELAGRILLHQADLTQLDLAPDLNPVSLPPIPFAPRSFNFIVADADHLGLNPDSPNRHWNGTRLLVSQILLALRAVYPGGTLLLKLSHVEHHVTARILIALHRISRQADTIKSKLVHPTRATFYLVARGVDVDSLECQTLIRALERLWCIMSFGGEAGYGQQVPWMDWDLVAHWEDEVLSDSGTGVIAQFGGHIWGTQAEALRVFLTRKMGMDIRVYTN